MSTTTTCDLCGSEAAEPALRFLADVDVCKACAERPILDLAPLFADLSALARRANPLSAREREVLVLLAQGLSQPAIARRLYMSTSTVRTYVARLCLKLDSRNRVQAIVAAVRCGLI